MRGTMASVLIRRMEASSAIPRLEYTPRHAEGNKVVVCNNEEGAHAATTRANLVSSFGLNPRGNPRGTLDFSVFVQKLNFTCTRRGKNLIIMYVRF